MSSRDEEMILLEEANHAIELVDFHLAVGLEIMDETAGQGNNGEGGGAFFMAGDLGRLQLGEGGRRSAAFSSKTEKLDLGEASEQQSGTARRLSVSF